MKQPTAVIGFAYFAGLLSATLLSPLAVIAVGFAAVAAALLKKVFFGSAYVLMTAAFGCGLLAFSFYQHFFVTPVLSASGAVVPIDGVVTAKTSTDNDSAFYTLSADINGANAKITCFLPDTNAEVGDSVLLTAKLSEISNTAAFAGRDYYSSKGILLTAVPDGEVTVVKRNSFSVSHSLSVLNTAVAERIAAFLPNDYGSMIIAVFLGDNSRMSYDLRDAFKRTGLSHFMSVSGMHVGLLAHIFMSCLLALPLRGGRKLRYALLLLFLTAMSLFFGLSPSVLRSSLMLAVFYGADITLRRRRTLNSMGAALLIILLINPSAAADPGLVLSFAGTFGVGIMAPAIMSRMKTSSFSKLKNLVVVSVSANICTLPFSALYFGGVSLVSVPANVLLAPLLELCLLSGIIFAVSGCTLFAVLVVGGLSAKLAASAMMLGSGFKYAYIPLDGAFVAYWCAGAAAFVLAVYVTTKKPKWCIRASAVAIACLCLLTTLHIHKRQSENRLYVYSDGVSAFTAVIENKSAVIVASGDSQATVRAAKNFLRENFVDSADLLVLLKSTRNNRDEFAAIPHKDYAFAPETNITATFTLTNGETLTLKQSGLAVMTAGGARIGWSTVKQPFTGAEIEILDGYVLTDKTFYSDLTVFTSKRMTAEQNAYYERAEFVLDFG